MIETRPCVHVAVVRQAGAVMQIGALTLRQRPVGNVYLECGFVVARSLSRCEDGEGPVSGTLCVLHDLASVLSALTSNIVMGDLLHVRVGAGLITLFENRRDPTMVPPAAKADSGDVERLSNEWVHELEIAGAVHQNTRRDTFFQREHHLVFRAFSRLGQDFDVELVSEASR